MTRRFIYPDVIAEIRAVGSKHRVGQVSADGVQRAESAIVAIEENDIRDFLKGCLKSQLMIAL